MDADPPGPGTPNRTPAISRRDFVKKAVVVGAVGAAAAAGGIAIGAAIPQVSRPPSFKYLGVKVLPNSPAPRGIPIIPVRTDAEGRLMGVPDRLKWYRYCGRQNAPGLAEDFATDNLFRYHVDPTVLSATQSEGIDAWYAQRLDQPARAADFKSVGDGAPAIWRSEGHEQDFPLTCLLIRVDPANYDAAVAQEFFPDGILGVYSACAHLCLVPTYRASKKGYGAGHWDDITCFGHGSHYSPRELVEYSFPPEG